MGTYAAVDLGAQSGRVAVGRFDGDRLGVTDVHRFGNEPVRTRDELHWDALRLFADVVDGLRAAAREAGRVDSIAVDSWGVDFALLDRAGRLLRNPVHYRDARRLRAVPGVLARIPARELYERTGIQLMPINTIFELGALAADGDPGLAAAGTMLMIPDLVAYWLCGARSTEQTNATTTQCLDARTGAWAADLLDRIDVPVDVLPAVVPPARRSRRSAPASPATPASARRRSSRPPRTTPPLRSPPCRSRARGPSSSAPARGPSSGWRRAPP
jgi:rhamnulokinase